MKYTEFACSWRRWHRRCLDFRGVPGEAGVRSFHSGRLCVVRRFSILAFLVFLLLLCLSPDAYAHSGHSSTEEAAVGDTAPRASSVGDEDARFVKPSRRTDKARIVILGPPTGLTTGTDNVTVVGRVEGPAPMRVRVGGSKAEARGRLFVAEGVSLKEGENTITVTAGTAGGESAEESFKVVHEHSSEVAAPPEPTARSYSAAQESSTAGITIAVNDTNDATDANPGDGTCETSPGNGACTLRAAVQETNALSGKDIIELPSGEYVFTQTGREEDAAATGDLDVTDEAGLIINGVNKDTTIVNANQLDRGVQIHPLSGLELRSVTITGGNGQYDSRQVGDWGQGGGLLIDDGNLTLTDSIVSSNTSSDYGGGIYFQQDLTYNDTDYGKYGQLNVRNSTIDDNTADAAGGISYFYGSTFILENSTLSGNEAIEQGEGYGGGILSLFYDGFAPQIRSSTITDNTAVNEGGGVYSGGDFTIENSVVNGNTTENESGGGISGDAGNLEINGSIVSNNIATGEVQTQTGGGGGGVYYDGGDKLSINGTTISDNSTNGGEGGGLFQIYGTMEVNGSAISNNKASCRANTVGPCGTGGGISFGETDIEVEITNTTISGNSAIDTDSGYGGGGIYNIVDYLTLDHVTLTGNTAAEGSNLLDNGFRVFLKDTVVANGVGSENCSGSVSDSEGHNLDSDGSCGLDQPTDLTNTDPLLVPLADNGGPTMTHALQPGSPAIDAGGEVCPPTDQRGVGRMQDGDGNGESFADIGAYELEGSLGPSTCSFGEFEVEASAPDNLFVENDTLTPNPFTVEAIVRYDGYAPAEDASVSLSTSPEGLTIEGEKTVSLGTMSPGEERRVSWQIRASDGDRKRSYDLSVEVAAAGLESVVATRQVEIPSVGDLDGDGLSNSVEEAQGTAKDNEDTDGDGLLDSWEVNPSVPGAGFDLDGDGTVDAGRDEVFGPYATDTGSCGNNERDLRLPSPCAEFVEPPDPLHKDLYLEMDWQDCGILEGDGCPEGQLSVPNTVLGEVPAYHDNIDPLHHAPDTNALRQVRDIFDEAPVQNPAGESGINLHVLIDEPVVHEPECDQGESEVRSTNFGTKKQRKDDMDGDVTGIIAAKEQAFRYVWSGHSSVEPGDEQNAQSNGCEEPSLWDQVRQGYSNVSGLGADLPAYDYSPFGDATAGGRDILVTLGPMWICPTKFTSLTINPCYRGFKYRTSPGIFPASVEGQEGEFSYPMSRLMGASEPEGGQHLWGRALASLLGQSLGISDGNLNNDPNLPAHDHGSGSDTGLGYIGPESYSDWSAVSYDVPLENGPDPTVRESNPDYALQGRDLDGDGHPEEDDNCPGVYNPDQENAILSVAGKACHPDDDGDGIPETPESGGGQIRNASAAVSTQGFAAQEADDTGADEGYDPFPDDTDNDGLPNDEDPDEDGDGIRSGQDNCPYTPNSEQRDADSDGEGDACDGDDDGDGLSDGLESTVGSDPLDEGSVTEFVGADGACSDGQDNDRDGDADGADSGCKDPDGDTNPDLTDNCPSVDSRNWLDNDGDGMGDACDETPRPADERPEVTTSRIWSVQEDGSATLTATATDPEGEPLTFDWDLDEDDAFETPGRRATFDATGLAGPTTRKVAVRATDPAGNSAVAYSTVNVLDVPVATLTEPEDGEVLSGAATLSAEASAEAGMDRVEFVVDGVVVGTDDTAPYSVEWDTTGSPDGATTMSVRAIDALGASGTSQAREIVVDNSAPDTSIVSDPIGFTSERSPSFSWTASDAVTDTSELEYSYKLDGGEWSAYSSATSVALSDLAEGGHAFYVKSRDAVGNEDPTPAERSFTVDTVSPLVAARTPDAGATGVPRNTNVIATFSEKIDSSSVTNTTFTLAKQGGTANVSAALSYDAVSRKATLNPASDLAPGTTYVVTVKGGSSGVKDLAGNPLAQNGAWTFTTADIIAPSPPTIDLDAGSDSGVSDTDNLTNDPTPTLSGSAEAGSVVKVHDGASLLGTTTASGSGNWSVTTQALTDGEHSLTTTATDAAGNASSESGTLVLTVDTTAPTASSVAPVEGSKTASAATNVSATFSEEVNPSTVGAATFSLVRKYSDGTTASVSGFLSYDEATKMAIIDPGSNLVAKATYQATIDGWSGGVRDLAGNPLSADKLWSFSVNSPPTITNFAPTPGATISDRTPTIAATIRDAQSTLAEANTTLVVDGRTIARTAYSYDASTGRLKYTSSKGVGKHTVKITAKDPQGLAAVKSWNFTVK